MLKRSSDPTFNNTSKRIQESSCHTHEDCPFLIFKGHLRTWGKKILYIYKSVSLYLYLIFWRQNANKTQSPPMCDEAKYLQTRLLPWQYILSFCGSEGQKDNISSSYNLLKRNVKPRRWQLVGQQTACMAHLTLDTLPCPVPPFKQSQSCVSVLWAFGQQPIMKTGASN